MKLFEIRLVVEREGYVKTEDEFCQLYTDAESIVDNYLAQLSSKLKSAGYELVIK